MQSEYTGLTYADQTLSERNKEDATIIYTNQPILISNIHAYSFYQYLICQFKNNVYEGISHKFYDLLS